MPSRYGEGLYSHLTVGKLFWIPRQHPLILLVKAGRKRGKTLGLGSEVGSERVKTKVNINSI